MKAVYFADSKLRLEQAITKAEELKHLFYKYVVSNPYKYIIEKGADGTIYHKYKLTKHPPEHFKVIVIEIFEHLRSALDLCACAATKYSGIDEPKKCMFPVAKEKSKINDVIRRNSRDIPTEIIKIFLRFKPYSDNDGDKILWSMCKIASQSKHLQIAPVLAATKNQIKINRLYVKSGSFAIPLPKWDDKKEELLILTCSKDTIVKSMNIEVTPIITLRNAYFIEKEDLIDKVDYLCELVKNIIYETEKECKKLYDNV